MAPRFFLKSYAVALLSIGLALGCTTNKTKRVGNFVVRTYITDAVGHLASRTSLSYKRRTLSDQVTDWSVDPNNVNRIAYATRKPCGTYLFDGNSGRTFTLATRNIVLSTGDDLPDYKGGTPWSPDGRYFFMGNDIGDPIVVDLQSHQQVVLSDALSHEGRRLDLRAFMWSPDGSGVVAIVEPGGYNDADRDLALITVSPLQAEYIATMTDGSPRGLLLWTTGDVGWQGSRIVVGSSGRNGPIVVRPTDQIRWESTPPTRAAGYSDGSCP